jgi:hypothetical protein
MWHVPRSLRMLVVLALVAVLLIPLWALGADARAGRVSPPLSPEKRLSPVTAPGGEGAPDLACDHDSDVCLVVWADDRGAGTGRGEDIYARLVGADGFPAGAAWRISGAAATGDERCPAVAFAGADAWGESDGKYLVVWQDDRNGDWDIYAQLLWADNGTPIVEDLRVSDTAFDDLCGDVTYSGATNQFFVVWEDHRRPARGADIYGRLVNAWDGALAGASIRLSGPAATADETHPAVTWANDDASGAPVGQFLAVWEDGRDYGEGRQIDTYGQRVSAAASLLGANFRISGASATQSERDPAVAWSGTTNQFLVVWWDERGPDESSDDVFGRVVQADGARAGAPKRIARAAEGNPPLPGVAWSGEAARFLVVWQDWRNADDPLNRGADVYGRLIGDDWAPFGAAFRVSGSNALGNEYGPAVAWSPGGIRFQVAWEDWREADPAIFGRRVSG